MIELPTCDYEAKSSQHDKKSFITIVKLSLLW